MRSKKFSLRLAAVLATFSIFTLMTARRAAAQTEKVLHDFGRGADGIGPESGLVSDAKGNLYGTADSGGSIAVGMVYELTSKAGQWVYKAIYNFKFNGRDGYGPWAGLIVDKAGNLYGTTEAGGLHDDGTVFELSPTSSGGWTESVLHSFNGTQGQAVFGGLTMDAAGNLYGTATGGGISTGNCSGFTYKGCGVVFELRHVNGGWAEEVLHYFNKDGSDGFTPYGTLAFDKTGNLYGTTSFGGAFNYGTVFKLTPTAGGWTESIVHSFNNNGSDGFYPSSGVIFDASGNLYGVTGDGANESTERGTVYELSPAGGGNWTETILYSFQSNGVDGTSPSGNLIFDSAGNLYGATQNGGANTFGTVFKLSPNSGSWSETILYTFGNPPDAEYPFGGLVFDKAGNLYGASNAGGANLESGTVFEITP